MNIFPFRVRFTKEGRLRFLSHHELMRLFERALRRSGLPVKMSEGFTPRPAVAFPVALATGIVSKDEVMEVELSDWVAPVKIRESLARQMPPEITILSVDAFSRGRREQVDYIEYEAELPEPPADLAARLEAFLALEEFVLERHRGEESKPVEIRRYVMDLGSDGAVVLMRIRNTDEGTARPDEVLRALGVDPDGRVRIVKTFTAMKVRA